MQIPTPTPLPEIITEAHDLLDYLAIIIPSVTTIGAMAKIMLDHRSETRRLKNEAESERQKGKQEHESGELKAASEMSRILVEVIDPLSKRIQAVENELMNKQQQILELSQQVIDLKYTVHQKDLEIAALTSRYNEQLTINREQIAISNELRKKVQTLETELHELRGGK